LSTENYICATCGLEVPKKNHATNSDGTKNIDSLVLGESNIFVVSKQLLQKYIDDGKNNKKLHV
jgi:hypothetical protein